jgi:hypothetical protein
VLRRYFKEGKLSTPIADRHVEDKFIDLSPDERSLYDERPETTALRFDQRPQNPQGPVDLGARLDDSAPTSTTQ